MKQLSKSIFELVVGEKRYEVEYRPHGEWYLFSAPHGWARSRYFLDGYPTKEAAAEAVGG